MAVVAVAVGKVTVNKPADVDTLADPKSNVQIAGFVTPPAVPFKYIKAPFATKLAPVHVTGAKERNAVVLLAEDVGT